MSTTESLLDLVEEITTSLDNNKYTIGVSIDIKKAFDTFNHEISVQKLHFYGLRGVAQKWIQNYLENRKQFVNVNNCHSEKTKYVVWCPSGFHFGTKIIYHLY